MVKSNKIFNMCIFMISGLLSGLSAQTITIEMEKDTVSLEEQFQVKYTIDDSCNASDLKFENFIVVAGPSISKSMSIINGERKAESSYTVLLTAIEEGTFELPNTMCSTKLDKAVKIVVKAGYESKEDIEKRLSKTRKVRKI